eukprot:14187007-Alexandrium_andersonii.AAC.1
MLPGSGMSAVSSGEMTPLDRMHRSAHEVLCSRWRQVRCKGSGRRTLERPEPHSRFRPGIEVPALYARG